jgi:hypothetical protein
MAEDDPDLKADLKAWREWNEKPVPLSAIRALVQQWRIKEIVAGQCSVEFSQETAEIAGKETETLARCIKELAALCPAPPEDHV